MRFPLLLCLALVGCGDVTNIYVVAAPDAEDDVARLDVAVDDAAVDAPSADTSTAADTADSATADAPSPDTATDIGMPTCCGPECVACPSGRICVQSKDAIEGKCACWMYTSTTCTTRSGRVMDHAFDCQPDMVPIDIGCARTGVSAWCCPW
jgi:hypothetical protein